MVKVLGLMTCFNRKEKTVNSIEKLINGNPDIEFSFIVADDNSKDGTAQALSDIPNVKVVNGNGGLYYSGGMRLAISTALELNDRYDYCLLFNDDVDFNQNAIENLVERAETGNCIWVGPTCDDCGKLSYGGVIKTSKLRPKYNIVMAETSKGLKCDTFNANCVLIPWDIFVKLGNIDKKYTHSMGDFDYGFAAGRKGMEIRVNDVYVGVCCDNPTAGSWVDVSLPMSKRLKLKESPKGLPGKEWFYYLNKNYSFLTALVYSAIPYVRILIKK